MTNSIDHQRYTEALQTLWEQGKVASFATLHMPGSTLPWTDSGIELKSGDAVTMLASGRIVTSEELGMWGGARFHLWRRILGSASERDSEVQKGTQDTTSFRARAEGVLQLAVCHGEWKTRSGELATPPDAYANVQGGLDVTVIVWNAATSAVAGLRELRALLPNDPLGTAELSRLEHLVERPSGWEYLWFLGESDTFSRREVDGNACIHLHSRDDAAILRKPVSLELDATSVLSWKWKVVQLPSRHAEDTLPCHDYTSIAVEFDCGRDLTYLWSSELEVGRVFACPIPQWTERETHVVVRSGSERLGTWQSETRNLLADYDSLLEPREPNAPPLESYDRDRRGRRHTIESADAPPRVVAIWLIGVSLFQHGEAETEFANIQFTSGGETVAIE